MDYNFTSENSTIKLRGCGLYSHYNLYYVKFKVGSIVYSKPKALKGVVEKIVIKKIRLFKESKPDLTSCRICNYPPLYIDTLNAYHNEEDLIDYAEVVAIIDEYLFNKIENINHC